MDFFTRERSRPLCEIRESKSQNSEENSLKEIISGNSEEEDTEKVKQLKRINESLYDFAVKKILKI